MRCIIYKIISIFFIFNLNICSLLLSNNAFINSIAIDENNKILAGGFYYSGDQFNYGTNTNFALARYNTDGTLDTTFNANGGQPGIAITPISQVKLFNDIPIATDVIRIPTSPTQPLIYILPSNIPFNDTISNLPIPGTSAVVPIPSFPLIPAFNPSLNNALTLPFIPLPQPNIYILPSIGLPFTPDPQFTNQYFTYTPNDFTTNRIDTELARQSDISQNNSVINGIAIDSKGRIVAVGFLKRNLGLITTSTNTDITYFAIARYNPDGTLDKTFNPNGTNSGIPGIVITNVDLDNVLTSVVIDADDNIITAGYVTTYNGESTASVIVAVAKYLQNGDLDETFNPGGLVSNIPGIVTTNISALPLTSQSGLINKANSVTLDSKGRIVVCGSATTSTYTSILVIRYNQDGTLDTTLNPNGINSRPGSIITNIINNYNGYAIANSVKTAIINGEEKIIITGSAESSGYNGNTTDVITIRYNDNGSLDTTFNPVNKDVPSAPGIVITRIKKISSYANGLAIDDTDPTNIKTVVAGYVLYTINPLITVNTNIDNNIIASFLTIRYNQDGSLDTTFNPNNTPGYIITDIINGAFASGLQANTQANTIALDSNNNVIIAGGSLNGSYVNDFALARYTKDGILDTTFDSTGKPPGTVVTVVNNGINIYENIFTGATVTQMPHLSSIEITPEEAAEVSAQFAAFSEPIILTPDNNSVLKNKEIILTGTGQPKSKINITIKNDKTNDKIDISTESDSLGKWNATLKDISDGSYTLHAQSKDPISHLIFKSNKKQITINNKEQKKTEDQEIINQDLTPNLNISNKSEISKKRNLNYKLKNKPINIFIESNITRNDSLKSKNKINQNTQTNNLSNNNLQNNIAQITKNLTKETLIKNGRYYNITYGNLNDHYVVSHKNKD